MSSAHPWDIGAFTGLLDVVEDYRRAVVRASVGDGSADPRRLAVLEDHEGRIRDCLHALGWWHESDDAVGRPSSPAGMARALVGVLRGAEERSALLVRRLDRAGDPVAPAARRAHALVQDALVIGAHEVATRLGVPDDELPA